MSALFRIILMVWTLAVSSPLIAAQEANTSPSSVQEANWSPSLETGDVVFPSLILATRNFDAQAISGQPVSPYYLGDATALFGVKFTNPAANTKVRVSVMIDGLSEESSLEAVLPKAGMEYEIMPHLRYKSEALSAIKQPYPTTAVFAVSINGAAPQQVVKNLNVRTVNDAPYAMRRGDNVKSLALIFAAYVNENAPIIDGIQQDALQHNAVQRFTGYSDDPQETIRQIFAIWNSLQRHDVRYSNIVAPSGEDKNFYSQHVRMPDESFENSQANCVDGSILMASALYKIGMCPVLISKPGHMFLGVYPDQKSCDEKNMRNLILIETTAVGAIKPLNALQKDWKFKTDTGYLNSLSYRSLLFAMQAGEKHFTEMLPALQLKKPGYYVSDVKQLRELGITPIKSSRN